MKQILMSVMASVMLYAGGELVADIEPIEYITVTEEPQASPFYLGAGIGIDNESEWDGDYSYSNLSLLAGAIIAREGNLGLALEGRATWSFDEYGVDSWEIFVKPEVEVDKSFAVYGILGYQKLYAYDFDHNAFGVGAGAAYMLNDSIGVMVDYVYSVIAEDEFGYVPEYDNLTASILYRF